MININEQINLDSAPKYQVLNQLLQPQDKIQLTAEDLEKLIPAAQQFDQAAMEKLQHGFLALVYDIAAKDQYYKAFGADAVSIVWETFFTIVQRYQGKDYARFPGMVKQLLYWRLNRMLKYEKGTVSGIPEEALEISDLEQVPDLNNSLEENLETKALKQALQQLGPQQKEATGASPITQL